MLSEKPWKVEVVLLLFAGVLISVSMGGLIIAALQHLQPDQSPAERQFHAFLVSAVSFQGMALVFVHQFLALHGMKWSDLLGSEAPALARALAIALIAGVVVIPLVLILNRLCAEALNALNVEPVQQQPVKIIQVTTGFLRRALSGVTAVLLAPLAEEVLFRGILYPLIKQRGFPRLALWITSLLFALIHHNLVTFIPLLFLSVVLTLLYERTDVLLAPIITHGLFNAVNFTLLILEPQLIQWN